MPKLLLTGAGGNLGSDAITVKYMFEHCDDFQIGERHSKDS